MINDFLTKHAPPGMDLKHEKLTFVWGIILSAVYSAFCFFARFTAVYSDLYMYIEEKPVLNVNAVMPDFRALIGLSFIGFLITSLIMAGFSFYHYAYYKHGSMSIYLMKRLPKKSELHKRSLTLPIIAVLLCIITVFLLLLIYFALYMLITPKACLSPKQWQILWRL